MIFGHGPWYAEWHHIAEFWAFIIGLPTLVAVWLSTKRERNIMEKVAPYAKAVAGGVAAFVGSLMLVITGNEGFSDVTIAEWLLVVFNVLGVFGITWRVPNKDA